MKKILSTLALCAAASFSFTSCDFDSISSALTSSADCAAYETQYQTDLAQEGRLNDQIHTTGDFAMAIELNASAINKLFKKASQWNYELGVSGVATINLKVPEIEIGGCRDTAYSHNGTITLEESNCLSFELPIEFSVMGQKLSAAARLGFPIEAVINKEQTKTSIVTNLKQAQILDLKAGSSALGGTYSALIETALKALIGNDLKTVTLFDIGAWEIGDNKIKMLAGAPKIRDAATKELRTVQFGMYSNIMFSMSESVHWEDTFPTDAEVGLHIHPDLIRGVLSRMMNEGHIEDEVSLGSNSSSRGFKVSMANIAKEYPQNILLDQTSPYYDPNWSNYFTFAFRLWSTDTFCGYMDVLAGLNIEISDQKFQIGVGNIHAGKTAGAWNLVGALLNTIIETPFFQHVLDYATISFNFNEFALSGDPNDKAQMDAKHVEFKVDGTGVNLYLNFLNLD